MIAEAPVNYRPPVLDSSVLIAQSVNRNIYGLAAEEAVIKVFKDNQRFLDASQRQARQDVAKNDRDRFSIRVKLEAYGSNGLSVVPLTESVLYDETNGSQSYYEKQRWYQNSKALAELNFGVLDLSSQALVDIRNIMLCSLETFQATGGFVDLSGSNLKRQNSFARKLQRRSFVLFSSENILVDDQGNTRLIDASVYEPQSPKTLVNLVSEKIQVMGLRSTIALINRNLKI